MATRTLQPMRVVQNISGGDPKTIELDEAASQTYKIGAVLTLDVNGYVVEGGTDPIRIIGVAARAGQNGAAAGDKKAMLVMANSDNIFEANLYHGTPASAIADRRMLGQSKAIVKVGNNWHIDLSDAAAGSRRALIVGFHPDDVIGTDVYHRARFVFLNLYNAFSSTS